MPSVLVLLLSSEAGSRVTSSHPLEKKFNAPIADILEAIERGFRTQVDIRGKLAELYLYRHLERLRAEGRNRFASMARCGSATGL